MDMTTITVHVRIDGRVQGVGFRAWVYHLATDVGLTGWVRNRLDGSVEAVFQGPRARVEDVLALCKRGPPGASVTSLEVVGEGVGAFESFEIRSTR